VTAWLEGPLEAMNSPVKPSLKISQQDGLCIAWMFFHAQWEVTVKIKNGSHQDQAPAENTILGRYKPIK
jgi:hypothetical protein